VVCGVRAITSFFVGLPKLTDAMRSCRAAHYYQPFGTLNSGSGVLLILMSGLSGSGEKYCGTALGSATGAIHMGCGGTSADYFFEVTHLHR